MGNVGDVSHKLVLPIYANNIREYFEDDCSPYLKETEVEQMQRKRSPAWKNSCAARQRKVELQHKGNKYKEWEYTITVQRSRIRSCSFSHSTGTRL